MGWPTWWKTSTPAALDLWHVVCARTGVNRRRPIGRGAKPEARRLRNIISEKEKKLWYERLERPWPCRWRCHRPRSSAEGRLRATRAVLIGCQLIAGWHVQRRLTRRLPLPSRDGPSSACPAPGAALRWARGQRRGRGGRRVRWRLQGARSEALAPKCFWTSYPFGTNLFEASLPHTTICIRSATAPLPLVATPLMLAF
jgi:hypothetical protein